MNFGLWNPFTIMVLTGLMLRVWTRMDWLGCILLGILGGAFIYEFSGRFINLYWQWIAALNL
ncbi:MAG: hypothetical protein R3310_00300 [Candidatus Competibacteraceae bacterium]|nr:hypothetical protein [Candidatus Competibacteraceae bacterium]